MMPIRRPSQFVFFVCVRLLGATMKDNVCDDGQMSTLGKIQNFGVEPLVQPVLISGYSTDEMASFLDASTDARSGAYRSFGKRIIDIFLVIISLPVTIPVTFLCAIALWIESGQPFYQQKRLGRDAREFSILKLRTMCRDADQILERTLAADPKLSAEWRHTQKLKNDPRITPVGAFLRKTSLDELPQFWNVLKGDMSLVGPRPMMPNQLSMYPDPEPYFAMRPGITGKWQVSDRNENGFSHRSTVDANYDKHLSMLLDLHILFQTVGVVLRRTGY